MSLVDKLRTASLSEIRSQYKILHIASNEQRSGIYKAEFIGPMWLRKSAAPSLVLSGLPGWYGKRFINSDLATNILNQNNTRTEKLQMHCQIEYSLVDGGVCVALNYGEHAPLPWRWVVDELRHLDENTLLCMTIINLPLIKHFSFPFLLSREI